MQTEDAHPADTPSRARLGYKPEAYAFVSHALEYTLHGIGEKRHVTGQELLEGIRLYALSQFGLLSRIVFENWGVHCTEDFGNIVFCLIAEQRMSRTESDSIIDFRNVYDFHDAFDNTDDLQYAVPTE